ncbi:EsaB/YukD family protein, partial [Gordonia sp. (in: high G+C Gram-positive bacteria)]|uniref:EsaB/YukD family protein n=1 Tax=Gordonia sp. (in: high G+C Gram-positive bacteria) TaxID=84139 RepID=UPI0039E5786E
MAGPESSIDVGLPADLPITDFLDELVLRLAGPPDVTDPTVEWSLSPLGRDALAPGQTLRDADIGDGTWLVLREGPAEEPAVLIDDTLDAVTEMTAARSWSPRAARIVGATTAAAAGVIG